MEKKELEIMSLGINGEGVAKENGNVFFVPFALPKEIVEVEQLNEKGNLKFCKLKNIIKKSSQRVAPRCKFFGICGGCNLEHLEYVETLNYKTELIKETLKKVAGIDTVVNKTIGSACYGYRNKMVFPIAKIDAQNIVGMFKEKSHKVVEISSCQIANNVINKVLKIFKLFLKNSYLEGFYENEKNGVLKYLSCRVLSGVPCVTLVATKDVSCRLEGFENLLKNEFENYSLWLNINSKKTSEILSSNFKFVGGEKEIRLTEFGIVFSVHPYSFMQVNNEIKEKLYQEVLDNIEEKEIVIDAYSGAGLLSAIISKKAKKVYGIEIIESATNDANLLKEMNKITNLDNINGDAAIKLPEVLKSKEDVTIVLDPPKAGVDEKLIKVLNKSEIKKIIYVACGLTTLCRDLKLLKENFEILKVQPWDMFPQTNHVETLVVMVRKNNK